MYFTPFKFTDALNELSNSNNPIYNLYLNFFTVVDVVCFENGVRTE